MPILQVNRYLIYSLHSKLCDMYLWGVVVLELDSHPEYNKGPDLVLVHIPIP